MLTPAFCLVRLVNGGGVSLAGFAFAISGWICKDEDECLGTIYSTCCCTICVPISTRALHPLRAVFRLAHA
ncbi:hypothetical protein FOVSG1_001291 [Fusarium oxysporum f. sp. vasinfectum]